MAQTTETYQFATEKATRLLGQMAFQVSRTVKSRNANAIHDLRVSIRRFTQVLTALKPCFPAKEAKKIRRRLGNIMTAAGEVRNRDIAVKLLSKYQAAEAGSLVRTLESQRRATERELVRSLRRWVDRNWTAKWRARLTSGMMTDGIAFRRRAIDATAQAMLPRMAKEFLRHGSRAAMPDASPKALHQFRVAAKKFRYTLELFAPLYEDALEDLLRDIRSVQTILGDVNDCETVRNMIAAWEGSKKVSHHLERREQRKMQEFTRHWQENFAGPENLLRWRTRMARLSAGGRAPRKRPHRAVATGAAGAQISA